MPAIIFVFRTLLICLWLFSTEVLSASNNSNPSDDLSNDLASNHSSEVSKAIQKAELAVSDAKQRGEPLAQANALRGLGKIYDEAGEYVQALHFHQQAFNIYQDGDDELKIAEGLLTLCTASWRLSRLDQALDYGLKALRIYESQQQEKGIGQALHNIGIVYDYLGQYEQALDYQQRALDLREKIGDKKDIAESLNNIGIIHYFSGHPDKALGFYLSSLKMRQKMGDLKGESSSLNNVGLVYKSQEKYDQALNYYQQSLALKQKQGDKYGTANILNNIGEIQIIRHAYIAALTALEQGLALAKKISAKELIRENYEYLSDFYVAQDDYKNALEFYKLSEEIKAEIFNEKISKQTANLQAQYETEKKEQQIKLLRKDNDIQQLKITQQNRLQYSYLGGLAFVVILLFFMLNRYHIKKKAHEIISIEKEKSDKLLHNVLPASVAADLKETGKTEPQSFPHVSVFFSDVVGFTKISSTLHPTALINELNILFTAFDNIIEDNHCERIKTIGDAYFAVCGMPEPDPRHAYNMVKSAREIIKYVNKRNETADVILKIRVGIHTGSATGGVVGIKKYVYDVFGDTVNTASRMESNSEPMRINISESTYQMVKDEFECEYRGQLEAKGKGKLNMYFVSGESKW